MDKNIFAALEKIIAEKPEAPVIVEEGRILSGKEFLNLVDELSLKLPENCRRVGILMEHSAEMIAAIFAALKRGAAYVPIEPFFPKERIKFMLKDAAVDTLVKGKGRIEKIAAATQRTENEIAYILYTSGTTGKPKGIAVTNANVLHYARAFQNEFHLSAKDIVLQNSVCTFDIFVEEVFCSILNGAALAIPATSDKKNIGALMDFVNRHGVTVISGFPYLLQEMNELAEIPKSLRLLISGGDVLRESYVDRLTGKITIYNTYGPGETTVCATYYNCTAGAALADGTYPIGKAVLGAEIVIDDGEICILGGGVSLGYIDRHQRDNKNFVKTADGRRMYRSGDLGYFLPDGNIAFLRRKDTQIMIFGKRVEVSEVENVLLQSELIRQAYVSPTVDEKHLAHMTAYIVKRNAATPLAEIKKYLSDYLVDFMVPEKFVELENLPLTPNGKVDKNALQKY